MSLSTYQTQELVSVVFLLSGPSQDIFQKVFLGCCSYYLYVAQSVWPDWAINLILGNFSNPLAAINLPQSPKFFCNFCKVIKIYNFSSENIFGQLLWIFGDFFWSHWSPVMDFSGIGNFKFFGFESRKSSGDVSRNGQLLNENSI